MYVSQYVKVSVLIPLIFSLQTDKVAMKRRFYQVFLTFVDIVVYSLLGIRNLIFYLNKDINRKVIDISSLITMLCITIALCISLRKIRKFTNQLALEGIISNEKLILAHQTSFVITLALLTSTVLLELFATTKDSVQYYREMIAKTSLDLILRIPWFIVNILMLRIFTRYGKPLEDEE